MKSVYMHLGQPLPCLPAFLQRFYYKLVDLMGSYWW